MSPAQPLDGSPDDPGGAHPSLLLVALQEAVVALPAEAVVEVLPSRLYAALPGADAPLAGLVNRRGRMLTVVDLGSALDGSPAAADPGHRIVVVAWRERQVGLAVKDVLQITAAWWTDDDDHPNSDEEESGEAEFPHQDVGAEADQQLEVVELDALLAPLFGGDEGDAEATETERS